MPMAPNLLVHQTLATASSKRNPETQTLCHSICSKLSPHKVFLVDLDPTGHGLLRISDYMPSLLVSVSLYSECNL